MKRPKFKAESYKELLPVEKVLFLNAIRKYFPSLGDLDEDWIDEDGKKYVEVTASAPDELIGKNIVGDKVRFQEGTGLKFRTYNMIDERGHNQFYIEIFNNGGQVLRDGKIEEVRIVYPRLYDTDQFVLLDEDLSRVGKWFSVITDFDKITKNKTLELRKEFDVANDDTNRNYDEEEYND